mgnify:CR=1 FL=1
MNGFVDLQVNGYAGLDFNSDQYDDQLVIDICQRLKGEGVDTILATVITAPMETMLARISRIADLIEQHPDVRATIGGIHVEGPFISPDPGYVGAHPPTAVRAANDSDTKKLLDAGRGHVRLVTLAPEMDAGAQVTRTLTDQNIVVAAGHSGATLDQLNESIDAGLKLFTHLGNGCPHMQPRHDNIVQRVLSVTDRIAVTFIADGHHVPPFALKNYFRAMPDENIIIITDAISAAGLGPGTYRFAHQTVEVDEDRSAWAPGREHYAGCATTMPQMVDVLESKLGIPPETSLRWMRDNPARLLA